MKKTLFAVALGCAISLCATGAVANKEHHPKESRQESMIIKASYALPRKDGDEFRQTMRESDQENRPIEQRIALAHADMYDLLTAEGDFDRKAFLDKSEEVRKLQEQTKDNRDEAFADAAQQLTPRERMTLAHSLEGSMHKSPAHHHKHVAEMRNDQTMQNQNARSGNTPENQTQTQ